MKAAQAHAARAVAQVLRGRTLDWALARAAVLPLEGSERALAHELSYGTMRHLGRLRGIARGLVAKPVVDLELDALLCVTLYQLQHGHASAHSVVSNAVDAAQMLRLTSAKGLVNAVLRKFLRERDAINAVAPASDEEQFSYPQWWIDRVRTEWPELWRDILDAGNQRPPLTLRVNRRRTTREAAMTALRGAGLACDPIGDDGVIVDVPRNVAELPGFAEGLLSVQDHGAQLAAKLLDVRDGMRVLDACAAPGGKTTHILESSDCTVVALERDEKRLDRVRDNLGRLGLAATTIAADAAEPQAWWDGTPFDRILADVPCTASGIVRRHPDSKWLRRPSDIGGFGRQQQRILDGAWTALGAGGLLLYVTCSVFRDENGTQVDAFVARHGDAEVRPLPPIPNVTVHGSGQLLPASGGTGENHDGFFYALIAKRRG